MTKLFALLALTLSTTAFAGADLTRNAREYDGQYSFDLMNRPEILEIVKSTNGAENFINEHSVASPAEVTNGQYLVFSGCMPQVCNLFGYMAIIDLKSGGMVFLYTVKEPISERISVAQAQNDASYEAGMTPANLPMNIYREMRDFTATERN